MRRLCYGGRGDLLALLAGSSLVLAFAPFYFYPVAIIAPALLFFLWHSSHPRRAFWRGWLFGVGMFGWGVSWVQVSLSEFGGIAAPVAYLLTLLFVMLMALYPALLGWLVVRIFPDCTRVRLLLVLPAGWTLFEWIRSWLFTGFPWLLLGYSQTDGPLGGLAPLIGANGISWVLVFTSSLLVYLLVAGRKVIWHVIPAIVLFWGGGWALTWVSWGEALEEPVKVALVQGSIPQEFTLNYNTPEYSLQRYLELSRDHLDADIMIWPETAIPLLSSQARWFLEIIEAKRIDSGPDFIIGIRTDELSEDGDIRYYNSALSLSNEPGRYHKRHLVPFGEFVPFRDWVKQGMQILQVPVFADFTPGETGQPLLRSAGYSIATTICYEDAFPSRVRPSSESADLLVNISNDAWFGDSIAADQHLQISRMRAMEVARYLLRATNTGISAIIDAKGQVIGQTQQQDMAVLRGEAQPLQGRTPFSIAGNIPLVFLMMFCVGVGFMLNRFWHLDPIEPRRRRSASPPSES